MTTCTEKDPYDVPEPLLKDFDGNLEECELPEPYRRCSHIEPGEWVPGNPRAADGAISTIEFIEAAIVDGLCADIVTDPTIREALERVAVRLEGDTDPDYMERWASLSAVERGTALLFDRIHAVQCDQEIRSPKTGNPIHGAFDPRTWTIKIYRTALTARSIYVTDINDLSIGFRYALVLGHELGHALDALTGDLMENELCAEKENRATLYGTYFAECISRILRIAVDDWLKNPGAKACILQRWKLYEFDYQSIRVKEYGRNPDVQQTLNEVSPAVAETISCMGL